MMFWCIFHVLRHILDLLKLNSELSSEKQAISDQFEASRIYSDKQTHLLEAALEQESKKFEEREHEYAATIEDYNTRVCGDLRARRRACFYRFFVILAQIDALQKQISSNTKFSAEQSDEREFEREQFQEEIGHLRDELDKRQLSRSDSKLSQEVCGDFRRKFCVSPIGWRLGCGAVVSLIFLLMGSESQKFCNALWSQSWGNSYWLELEFVKMLRLCLL